MSVQRPAPAPAPARQRVQAALTLAPFDPPALCRALALSPATVARALDALAAQGAVTRAGHTPRQRRGGLRAVRWRLAERA